jgi:pimeloyl-ACP methyl ester carboxylesterase
MTDEPLLRKGSRLNGRSWARWCLVALGVTIAISAAFLWTFNPIANFERDTLNPGPRSDVTPATLGLKFERLVIKSGPRKLDAFLVKPTGSCRRPSSAVLIFHGRNETIADWVGVQQYLQAHCVTSVVFDYSGHGLSEGQGSIKHLNEDAQAAISYFFQLEGLGRKRCLLAHSMGNAVMLQAVIRMPRQPECLVLANPFASLKSMALANGLPQAIAFKFPDVWNNVQAARAVNAAVLWSHSSTDAVVPIYAGQSVFAALPSRKYANIVSGLSHNAIYEDRSNDIWIPILRFIEQDNPLPKKARSLQYDGGIKRSKDGYVYETVR